MVKSKDNNTTHRAVKKNAEGAVLDQITYNSGHTNSASNSCCKVTGALL